MTTDLQNAIETAWENRDQLNTGTKGAVRDAVEAALACSTRAVARGGEDRRRWQVNQWLKKAVLLSFRLNDMATIPGGPATRAGPAVWWDKVPSKFAGWDDDRLPRRRLPRRARLRRAPLGLHRAGRRADAVLRQSRRLCRQRHHGRHLGHGRLLRPDRQERATSPAAPASAACWSRCRPARSSSRTTASSAPAPRWPRASSSSEGSVLSMGVYLGASTKIVDRATGEVFCGRVPPYSVVVSGTHARQAAARRQPRPQPLLRRDRQAGRRADPRPRPRSTSCCATDGIRIDPVALTQALIRCPCVTPDAMPARSTCWQRRWSRWASPATALRFEADGHAADRQSLRPAGRRPGRNLCFAGHTDVVPPGDASGWAVDPFAGEIARRQALRPRRRRHEERRSPPSSPPSARLAAQAARRRARSAC